MNPALKFSLPVLASWLLVAGSGTASAQHYKPYPYPYPYPVAVYAPYAGAGGYQAGQSKVIDKWGNYQIQQQDAQIKHQNALQEQIKTKKMEFQWEAYKKAHTPTFGQEQQAIKTMKEYRILTNATEGEIASGEALNILVSYLNNASNFGAKGSPVALQPALLSKINVVPPYSAGSAGVLKSGGTPDFPLVLKGETQQQLAALLPKAVAGSVDGSLDFKLYQEVRKTLEQLRAEHKKKFHKSEIDGGSFLVGTRFLDSLEDSVKVLEQPTAAKIMNGTCKAQGDTVQELVQHMTSQGLKFAPAVPGDEAAYMALHASMVSYAAGLPGAASFAKGVAKTGI